MDQSELYDDWQKNNDRPIWVREHRDEIHDHIDIGEPIPDKGAFHVRQWLERYKSTVSRQLNPENNDNGEDGEEADN